jgi:vacuolar-type H+-ATPase subunit D/Vma8
MGSGFLLFHACFPLKLREISRMSLPSEPVTLSVEQISELKQKLSDLRHDVNNNVSLMLSAVEMIRRRPESTQNMLESFARQPQRINDAIAQFSKALESALKLKRH